MLGGAGDGGLLMEPCCCVAEKNRGFMVKQYEVNMNIEGRKMGNEGFYRYELIGTSRVGLS